MEAMIPQKDGAEQLLFVHMMNASAQRAPAKPSKFIDGISKRCR